MSPDPNLQAMGGGDLELRLEAAPGYSLPAECFASVRPGDALSGVAGAPMRCVPDEASRLCKVIPGGGTAVVDIFQKVGTITVNLVEPGSWGEESIKWPGLPELRLRLALVAASAAVERPPAPAPEKTAAAERTPEPRKEAAAAAAASEAAQQHWERLRGNLASLSALAPGQEEPREFSSYKPVSLANCNQIIPNLYLGGVAAASDTRSLVQQGIRAVCCCCRELEFREKDFSPDLEYFRVDVEDMGREPIDLYIPEATEFINSWLSREQPVLVHCRAGVSRSASIVIAYLMTYHNYNLHDAFFLVRSHRSVVTPNIGFMEKLGDYEQRLTNVDEPTIDINKYITWYQLPERAAVPDLKPD